jgi:CHAD domain-containing protein
MPKGKAFRWDELASPGANARRRLPELVRSYYEDGRKVTSGDAAPDSLHEFRLRTKKLRYTVELFRSCYGPGLDRWLATLRQIQDHLGAISDCATTRKTCRAALAKGSADGERLESYLNGRAAREVAAFQRYWRDEFDKTGEARRWEIYLRRKTR